GDAAEEGDGEGEQRNSPSAEGDPEPGMAELMTNHLHQLFGTMAQALLERRETMTIQQMADDIPGRTGYPSTNIPSLDVVNYIIQNVTDEMDE
ncbi:unnamed protein product, partial [Ectocarpus sp. 12 AP-2014]